jgi:hypothetical protein
VTAVNSFRLFTSYLCYMRVGIMAVLLFFLVQIGMRTLQVVNFYVQQDRIEELFCVNKDKPKLQCHGKCHLSKQIAQEEKKTLPVKQILESELTFSFVIPVISDLLFGCPQYTGVVNTPYCEMSSSHIRMELIRPPGTC